MANFRVYHLHGLGSSCEGTKAGEVKRLTENLGGEFNCITLDYLRKGAYPWEVLETLKGWVKTDKPFLLIGSSMGAYTWLDFLVNSPEVLSNPNLKRVILITPPTTLFDNLQKWNPLYGREKIFLLYGGEYIEDYKTFIRLMHWDIKHANGRLLTLAYPKVVSVVAKKDTVVDNTPVYKLKEVAKSLNLYELDDDHTLHNRLDELMGILRGEIEKSLQ